LKAIWDAMWVGPHEKVVFLMFFDTLVSIIRPERFFFFFEILETLRE